MAYNSKNYSNKNYGNKSYSKKPYVKPVKPEPTRLHRNWSPLQKVIFSDIESGIGNTQIDAYAGTGKTSTIVEGSYYVPPGTKTLMVAFNKSIKEELEGRVKSGIDVLTLHAAGYRAARKAFPRIGQPDFKKADGYIQAELGNEQETYELRDAIKKTVSLAKGYLANTDQEIDLIIDKHGIDTCDNNRQDFIGFVIKILEATKRDTNRVDFDDMIWFPNIHNLSMDKYGFVFVDESQDLNQAQINIALNSVQSNGRLISVGDQFQCADIYTVMATDKGNVFLKDLKEGDKILSFRNGKNTYQTVSKMWASNETDGYQITTKSGKSITLTANHQIWASLPEFKRDGINTLVYLMYRKDLGFRIGITNKAYSRNHCDNISSRLSQEGGDKMWILDWCSSRKEAILKEHLFSLKFGVPTLVFNGTARGLDQDMINKVFKETGDNGYNLLKFKRLEFAMPHWAACSAKDKRTIISVNEHTAKGTIVTIEWTECENHKYLNILNENGIKVDVAKRSRGKKEIIYINRFRVRKYFNKNNEAMKFASFLSSILSLPVSRKLVCSYNRLSLMTVSSLFVGMKIPVRDESSFVLDEIVSIEKVPGQFIDIEVTDTHNFYGNDILSHNCIYSFRGADEHAIDNIVEKCNSKRLPLSVTYRCARRIVEMAQKYVPEIEAAENAEDGLIEDVSVSKLIDLAKPGDFVLSRINAPLISHCMKFIRANIPANIQGRDVGQSLAYMIKKSKADDVMSFLHWLEAWRDMEVQRLSSLNRDYSLVEDKYECLLALSEGAATLDNIRENIKKLFDETDDKNRVIFSSTHKAKGLERDRVFLLANTYKPSRGQEERNLLYVAITRAKRELYLVQGT